MGFAWTFQLSFTCLTLRYFTILDECSSAQEANSVEEVEDRPDFWSGPVQSYNSPVVFRFLNRTGLVH